VENDPVTTAILAALAAGVTSGTAKVAESVIVDAYNALKGTSDEQIGERE